MNREDGSLEVKTVGTAAMPSCFGWAQEAYVNDEARILKSVDWGEVRESALGGVEPELYELAGPRDKVFYEAEELTAGIVTCGGLCPGLNDVIRSITLSLWWQYGVKKVLGFSYGYEGLSSNARQGPIELTPKVVDAIQHKGGTILGSSRGPQTPEDMVATLGKHGVGLLFVIGGDGTFKGAHALFEEIARQGLPIGVIGLPKTIDNDIYCTEVTFGYSTSVEEARQVINSAHTEALAAFNGVSVVKLMGRDSGFIAGGATLANSDVNFCLIPEVPLQMEGPGGFLSRLEERLERKQHAVVVVAEGVAPGEEGEGGQERRDASGNVIYEDVGLFLKRRIKEYFAERDKPVKLLYFDPSYSIRSCKANARDSIFCLMLGQNAVHAGMAGKTDMFIGYWNQHFTHVPLTAAIGRRKQVELHGQLWQAIRAMTE
ncbi:MAG: ATP-dependent 6-phosphofructokinase [Planctomycetes bacterium]|nr:ATP-dependent 6-phosphofructokinase [Planctomycetota bacterium]